MKNNVKTGKAGTAFKAHSIFRAVFTLTAFSAVVKTLGFAFRIILSRNLGAEMMGVYSIALSIYFMALTLTSGGLPLVVGRKIAKFRTVNDRKSENAVVTAALLIGIAVSMFICALFSGASALTAKLFSDERVLPILMLLLPGIVATAIHSAFYGALWGRRSYFAVSMIELIEQILRIGLCFLMLTLFPNFNKVFSASLSLSASCACGALIAMLIFLKTGGRFRSGKGFYKPLIVETAPITGIRLTGSAVNSIIALILPLILVGSGMSKAESLAAYGAAIGMALPLLFMPGTVVGSLAVALVPELAANAQKKDGKAVNAQIGKALAFSILVCCLSMPFYYSTGNILGVWLYKNADAGRYLVSSTWIMLPVSLEQISGSMMNSLGLELKSYRNYCVTAVILFACIIFLPKLVGVHAYFIGLGASSGVQAIMHIWEIRKKTGFAANLIPPLLKSIAAAAVGAAVGTLLSRLMKTTPAIVNILVSGASAVLVSLAICLASGLVRLPALKKKAVSGISARNLSNQPCP